MATPTEAALCNIALSRIGVRADIDDLLDESTEGEACAICYPQARDRCLEAVPWKFASRRKVLALAGPTITRTNWDLVYLLPVDCAVPRFLVPDVQVPGPQDRIPWDWGDDDTIEAGVLMTDRIGAELEYTARFTDVARFPALFVEAVAWSLASDLALRLPNKANLAEGCEKQATRKLLQAAASQLRQQQTGVEPEADTIRVRGVAPDPFSRER